MKRITESIWSSPDTFPARLAAACRAEYIARHPNAFAKIEDKRQPIGQLDKTGRALMALASDLLAEALIQMSEMESRTTRSSSKTQRRKSTELFDKAKAARAFEASKDLEKQKTLVQALLGLYAAGTIESLNGKRYPGAAFDENVFLMAREESEQPCPLPQEHAANQAAVWLVRILAGNDDPAQTGLLNSPLRAFPAALDGERVKRFADMAGDEEALLQVEDLVLRRISTLIATLFQAELGIPPTLENLAASGKIQEAAEALNGVIVLIGDIFWELVECGASDGSEESAYEAAPSVFLRGDWAVISGERIRLSKSAAPSSFLAEFLEEAGLPPELRSLLATGHGGCGDPACAVCSGGLNPLEALFGGSSPGEEETPGPLSGLRKIIAKGLALGVPGGRRKVEVKAE